MIYSTQNRKQGFIALISAVIISAILVGFLFTTNASAFYARFDAQDSTYKRVAEGLAESCVDQTLLRLGQNYSYDPAADAAYVAGKGVPIVVGDGTCYIVSTTPPAPRTGNSTKITVYTQGVYKNTFSDFKTQVTAWNPTVTGFTPPPSCYVWTNTNSIFAGQSVTLGWSTSNATSFKIIAQNNHLYDINPAALPSGSQSIPLVASESFVGTVTNSVGSAQCTTPTGFISPSIIVQPPATCADTAMIFDRTGSMSNTDLSNEKNAGNTLLGLYQGAVPQGQVSIGSFGGLDGSAASIPANGLLSKNWASLGSAMNSVTGSNSSVGSNLSAAITAADTELGSARHDPTKAKVLIFVTDGEPTEPSSTVTPGSVGPNSPSASVQNGTGDSWSNPTNAYVNGGGAATDTGGHRERLYNFNFAAIPSGSTAKGITVNADSWATASPINTPANVTKTPTATSLPNQWTNPTKAFASDDVYATDTINGHTQGYGNFGFAIPSTATIQGIQITAESKILGTGSASTATLLPNGQGSYTSWTNGESVLDESGTPSCSNSDSIIESTNNDRESVIIDLGSIPNGSTITNITITSYDQGDTSSGGTYKTFARLNSTNTDASTNLTTVTTSSCNTKTQSIDVADTIKSGSTDLEVGVVKINSGGSSNNTVRVGAIRAVVNYIPATTGSIGVALSSNNGTTWTTTKNVTTASIEAAASPAGNSSSDLWSRAWVPSDFNNGNFILRTQNNSTTGATVSLDQITTVVYYTIPVPGPVACQLGIDLSWNGGSSWTGEKTMSINGTETTYTFGSATDDWSGHTWAVGDFTNTNFRARVHNIDPDPGSNTICSDTAVQNLDWLQTKIDYTTTVVMDPSALTVTAANTAKSHGVEIFTVRYSTDTNATAINLLKNIASGPGDYFPSPTTQAGITAIFNTIGTQVCPAALPPPIPPAPPLPPPPPPPPPNITIGSWIEATTTH